MQRLNDGVNYKLEASPNMAMQSLNDRVTYKLEASPNIEHATSKRRSELQIGHGFYEVKVPTRRQYLPSADSTSTCMSYG